MSEDTHEIPHMPAWPALVMMGGMLLIALLVSCFNMGSSSGRSQVINSLRSEKRDALLKAIDDDSLTPNARSTQILDLINGER